MKTPVWILGLVLLLALSAAAIIGIVLLIGRATQRKASPPPTAMPPPTQGGTKYVQERGHRLKNLNRWQQRQFLSWAFGIASQN